MLNIDDNNHALIILFWIIIFAILAILLKYLQKDRYKDELKDVEDIFSDNIGGFDL